MTAQLTIMTLDCLGAGPSAQDLQAEAQLLDINIQGLTTVTDHAWARIFPGQVAVWTIKQSGKTLG